MEDNGVIYMNGIGYRRVELQETTRDEIRQFGEGTSPFLILPVASEGRISRKESRIFRNINFDVKSFPYEVVHGKSGILRAYEKSIKEQGSVN
jgi:hypothetical protein